MTAIILQFLISAQQTMIQKPSVLEIETKKAATKTQEVAEEIIRDLEKEILTMKLTPSSRGSNQIQANLSQPRK